MNTAPAALIVTAAGALLVFAYEYQRLATQPVVDGEGAYDDGTAGPDWVDQVDAAIGAVRNVVTAAPVSDMVPSGELLAMLRRGENLKLQRYELGDGGWTIGWGHFTPYSGAAPPEHITAEEADQIFADDVESRAARWVRAFVTVPLEQYQFDALTSMSFNLSPKSFKTIAAAVNAGDDPEDAALHFVLAGTNKERGLRLRRARELALYREGIYA